MERTRIANPAAQWPRRWTCLCALVGIACSLVGSAAAQDPAAPAQPAEAQVAPAPSVEALQRQRMEVVNKALEYLATTGQAEDGTFTADAGPGVTALALTAALRNGRPVDDAMVAKGLKALEGFVKPDGGIYGAGRLRTYETSAAVMCFSEANADGRYQKILDDAQKFLTSPGLQVVSDEGEADPRFGGYTYGGVGRPDLSNTAYLLEALHALKTDANDVAIQRALVFVSRCQNLDSQFNTLPWAGKVNDGGFYYLVPTEEELESGSGERFTEDGGGLRSYGSMTYNGLKSMIYAGLTDSDPRVKAAVEWIGKNYRLDENPGMGNAGLYYYYHTFGAALTAAKVEEVVDPAGVKHPWKADLVAALASRQKPDGSWTNENGRWMEDNANLATSFALMALSYCGE
jgi:squalene-hopene/tetraprenyl-beta-curcumene cyclase